MEGVPHTCAMMTVWCGVADNKGALQPCTQLCQPTPPTPQPCSASPRCCVDRVRSGEEAKRKLKRRKKRQREKAAKKVGDKAKAGEEPSEDGEDSEGEGAEGGPREESEDGTRASDELEHCQVSHEGGA